MTTKRFWAVPLLATLALGSACSSGDNHPELDPFLCQQADLGPDYQQLTEGDISPKDLADLGPDARAREKAFRAAGMQQGRFAVFKQSLPKPPFDPPVNVVCQVLEFDSAEHAEAWVSSLQPDDTLIATVVGRIPEANRTITATDRDHGFTAVRVASFDIHAGEGDEAMNATYYAVNEGRTVFTLVVGVTATKESPEQNARPGAVLQSRAERLKDTPLLR